MRMLRATTCLTPIMAGLAMPAAAEVVINDARTAGIATATATTGGAPDNIRIGANGSIKPASGNAVTVNSANSVTNQGTIQFTGVNNAAGIHANAGTSGGITNSGKIILDENFTPTDGDNDGDLDGPFAQGSGRFGIRTAGAYTGTITNTGTITIEGNDSAGIQLGGPLTGSLSQSGPISVVGNNSVGVRAGAISGDVRIAGAVAVQGASSVGVDLTGDIGGALVIQGTVATTGYRSTTVPSDTSKLDADDLLQGGPAVRVAGNVGGGIVFAIPPKDNSSTDPDEDDDGIPDASEGSAAISSAGAAPAVQIGSTSEAIAIGAVAGSGNNGHGVVVNGSIAGNGVYKDVAGNGIVIGGLGGDVTVAGGMTVNGTITASSNNASATAARIGAGASVPIVRNTGVIAASGGGAAGSQVRAIAIDSGAAVQSITNSGRLSATAAGDGVAAAISDKAGTVTLVQNSGTIEAKSSKTGVTQAVAIDLGANTSGVIIRQTVVASGVAAPTITGSVLTGTGDDLFEVADGSVVGTTRFGAGNDRLTLSGDATYAGDAEFGAGADALSLAGTTSFAGKADFGGGADTLTLAGTSRFTGTLANSGGLALTMTGGTLDITSATPVALASMTISGQSTIGVRIDESDSYTQYQVAGAASFGQGSAVRVQLANVAGSAGNYVIVDAGTLTGGANLTSSSVNLPFLFKSSLTTNEAQGQIVLNIAAKTTTELGLTGSRARAYDAIFDAIDADAQLADVFLGIGSSDDLSATIQQMLPDHSGGLFETVTQGSRATARFLADPNPIVVSNGRWGFWLQQVAWKTSKDRGDTASYDVSGWGFSGGLELPTGQAGHAGISLAYLAGQDGDDETENEVKADVFEAAAYWRGGWGGLRGWGRLSGAYADFSGDRIFVGNIGGDRVTRRSSGSWNGWLLSAAAGLSYEIDLGRFSLRPAGSIDYYRLKEDGYSETGGGAAFDLIVDERTSDEAAANATLTAGYDFGGKDPREGFFRVELEGGRREIISGSIGETVARFEDGEAFSLLADERDGGWIGKARILGGAEGFRFGGEVNAEDQNGNVALGFRATFHIGL